MEDKISSLISELRAADGRHLMRIANPYPLRLLATAMFVLSCCATWVTTPTGAQEQVCEVGAGYFLGFADYPEVLRLHREIVRAHPKNALAVAEAPRHRRDGGFHPHPAGAVEAIGNNS